MHKRVAMDRYLFPAFPQNVCKQYTEPRETGGQYETDQNNGKPDMISEKQLVTIRARFAFVMLKDVHQCTMSPHKATVRHRCHKSMLLKAISVQFTPSQTILMFF
jgi:hypothetical protein